jgi:hypothetical protein
MPDVPQLRDIVHRAHELEWAWRALDISTQPSCRHDHLIDCLRESSGELCSMIEAYDHYHHASDLMKRGSHGRR